MSAPTWLETTQKDFAYDRWANLEWLPAILEKGTEEDRKVYAHSLGASHIWLRRLHGESLTAIPNLPFDPQSIESQYQGWIEALSRVSWDQIIEYRNLQGDPFSMPVWAIARHVVNHGTYHRGQLRETFGARGEAFPETDFFQFAQLP